MSDHPAVTPVTPITAPQRRLVEEKTREYVSRGEQLFDRSFTAPPVRFDLSGKTAGMYRVRRGDQEIRYNPYLFARYFEENLSTTVPHEVAHFITHQVYGLGSVRPHGQEWQTIMRAFGAKPERTCQFDMTGIPSRQYRRFNYRCDCMSHALTAHRHNRIVRGERTYACRRCGVSLTRVDTGEDGPPRLARR